MVLSGGREIGGADDRSQRCSVQHGYFCSIGNCGELFLAVIPRDCKIVRKSDALPDLFNLKLVEVNYKGGTQMRAVKELVVAKDPEIQRKIRAMDAYLGNIPTIFMFARTASGWTNALSS